MFGFSSLEQMVLQTAETDTCFLQKLFHYIPTI